MKGPVLGRGASGQDPGPLGLRSPLSSLSEMPLDIITKHTLRSNDLSISDWRRGTHYLQGQACVAVTCEVAHDGHPKSWWPPGNVLGAKTRSEGSCG